MNIQSGSKSLFALCAIVVLILSNQCFSQPNLLIKNVKRIMIYTNVVTNNDINKVLIYKTSDSHKIDRIVSFLTSEKAPYWKCGYTGCMEMYTDRNDNYHIAFNTNEECRHYVLITKLKTASYQMNREGVDFLDSLFDTKLRGKKVSGRESKRSKGYRPEIQKHYTIETVKGK